MGNLRKIPRNWSVKLNDLFLKLPVGKCWSTDHQCLTQNLVPWGFSHENACSQVPVTTGTLTVVPHMLDSSCLSMETSTNPCLRITCYLSNIRNIHFNTPSLFSYPSKPNNYLLVCLVCYLINSRHFYTEKPLANPGLVYCHSLYCYSKTPGK